MTDREEAERAERAKKVKRIMDRALRDPRFAPAYRAAVEAISSMAYAGFGNNKTGAQTTLKFSSGKVKLNVKLGSHLVTNFEKASGWPSGWRPDRHLREALWEAISGRFGLSPLWGDVNEALERANRPIWYAYDAILDRMFQDAPAFPDLLRSTIRSLRDSGEHGEKFKGHLMETSIRELREVFAKVLGNGLSRDRIVEILDEETVRSVHEG